MRGLPRTELIRKQHYSGSNKTFDHRCPSTCEIRAVITATAQAQHTAMTQPVRQLTELTGGKRMRRGGISQMSDGIALQAVRAALKHDEFRLESFQMFDDARPGRCEQGIVGARRYG